MILTVGSCGSLVKLLQTMLGLNADGQFGHKTELAVKQFQKENSLVQDGIVGDKTWSVLQKKYNTFNVTNKAIDDSIIYSPLSDKHITKQHRNIEYIVIHFTAGSNSNGGRAILSKNTFETREASADFVIDDENIVQFNPDLNNYYCWSVGGKKYGNKGGSFYCKANNRNTVNIELCSTCVPNTRFGITNANHSGWSFTDKVLDKGVKLVKILMQKYNIDINHVIRHYDVTGKLCPGIVGWNDEDIVNISGIKTGKINNSNEWIKFKDRCNLQ